MPAIELVVIGLVAAASYAVAFTRRGRVATMPLTGRRIELRSPGDPESVFAAIVAIGPPYRVDDADRDKLVAVLSSPPSIWNRGFFYPVAVHPALPDEGSRIEVGVRSKGFGFDGALRLGRAQVRCARAIRRLLTIPPARQIERS